MQCPEIIFKKHYVKYLLQNKLGLVNWIKVSFQVSFGKDFAKICK